MKAFRLRRGPAPVAVLVWVVLACVGDEGPPGRSSQDSSLAPRGPVSGDSLAVTMTALSRLGGSGLDDCDAVAFRPAGGVVLGCHSNSFNLSRGTSPSYTLQGGMDAFVIALGADGRQVDYLAHFGGSSQDGIVDVAVGPGGDVFVVGSTRSDDLISTQSALRPLGTANDVFVARLSVRGTVEWFTYFGGSGPDDAGRIAIDRMGNVVIAGRTGSHDLPTSDNAMQRASGRLPFVLKSQLDAFVAKFSPTGRLIHATYVGGAADDIAAGLAVDAAGNVYLSGQTNSPDFPLQRPLRSRLAGGDDCFVTILDSEGDRLLFSSYWGGSAWDRCSAIAVDTSGRFAATGETVSTNFPTTRTASRRPGGGVDAFVTTFAPLGRAVEHSMYLGGDGDDSGGQVVMTSLGAVWITGTTASNDFPTVRPLQPTIGGGYDGFMTLMDLAGGSLLYSSYVGGLHNDLLEGAATTAGPAIAVSILSASQGVSSPEVGWPSRSDGYLEVVVARFAAERW